MKIFYIAHATSYNYRTELYDPLKKISSMSDVEFIFPHDASEQLFDSHSLFLNKGCDAVIAEISYPSTGVGIELGWAYAYDVPIIALCKKGQRSSSSIHLVTQNMYEYENENDLIEIINKYL